MPLCRRDYQPWDGSSSAGLTVEDSWPSATRLAEVQSISWMRSTTLGRETSKWLLLTQKVQVWETIPGLDKGGPGLCGQIGCATDRGSSS